MDYKEEFDRITREFGAPKSVTPSGRQVYEMVPSEEAKDLFDQYNLLDNEGVLDFDRVIAFSKWRDEGCVGICPTLQP